MLLPDEFTAPAGMTIAIVGNGNVSSSFLNFDESDYASNHTLLTSLLSWRK